MFLWCIFLKYSIFKKLVSASQAVGVLAEFGKANNRKYAESYNMKLKFRPSGSCSGLADLSKPLLYFCFPSSKIKPVAVKLRERVRIWAAPRGLW